MPRSCRRFSVSIPHCSGLVMNTISAVLVVIAIAQGSLAWKYEGAEGPDHWGDDHPDCNGERQSPVDISTMDAEYQSDLYEFDFHGYDSTSGLQLKLKNNGHAAQVDIEAGSVHISGGQLNEDYKLAQFHFHWGSDDEQGSEHTVNGQMYPMEVHFVHFGEQHGDLGTAADKPNGLAVLGFFFEIGSHNAAFDTIINNLEHVTNQGSSHAIDAFTLESLLPRDLTHYYRYQGSLTTPGCFQSVIWTVFDSHITISKQQMAKFRMLMADDGHHIMDNYRPVQVLGRRVVHTNMMAPEGGPSDAAVATNAVSAVLLTVAALVAKLFV